MAQHNNNTHTYATTDSSIAYNIREGKKLRCKVRPLYAAAAHTSGSTIPATTTKRHTVQNMAALTAVYQSFYGHPSWEAHCTIKI